MGFSEVVSKPGMRVLRAEGDSGGERVWGVRGNDRTCVAATSVRFMDEAGGEAAQRFHLHDRLRRGSCAGKNGG